MAQFLKSNQLNAELERIFEEAQSEIVIISPYIKIHSRYRDILKRHKDNAKLKITLVFGKNEEDVTKSLNRDDFELLKDFPNVEIKYEPRLHAKYYSNENMSLLSSMNLYDFSQNNNIEFGILTNGSIISGLKDLVVNDKLDSDAMEYFAQVMKNCQTLFRSVPQFESKMLGITKKYTHPKIEVNELTERFLVGKSQKPKWKKPAPSFKKEPEIEKKKAETKKETKSATQVGKLKGMTAAQVTTASEALGLISNGKITAAGMAKGLEMKKYMGNEYIAYPVDIELN